MSEREDFLKEKVSLLPLLPGVYQFMDDTGTTIYVGKAKSLRKRVSSYFTARDRQTGKLRLLVNNIADMKHTVVSSESDALLLENNMIKSLRPRYNILLKDDKTYPWIAIQKEAFPRVISTRTMRSDGSIYFGPYASVFVQKTILELVRSIYNIRTCALNLSEERIAEGKYSVCLEYHIGNCKAPCIGQVTEQEYNENIANIKTILKGDLRSVESYLTRQMHQASKELKFEVAHTIKQKLDTISLFQSKSVLVNSTISNVDVFFPIIESQKAYCTFIRVVRGAVISSLTVEMKLTLEETQSDILTFAIMHIAEQVEGGLSKEVLVPFLPEIDCFENIKFSVPQRGDKLKLLEFAEKNCKMYRIEQLKYVEKTDPARHSHRIMEQMASDLQLRELPTHIECFDNSNIQGHFPVAACVVFRDGRPARRDYRHFNIKTVVGADDFASMEEVMRRRYTRLIAEGGELPQLIVIDGGKGQLGMAYGVLCELELQDKITIIGLAKRLEEIFYPNDSVPLYLSKSSETLKVLMHIRDEAHRFGITFHRNKRSAAMLKSELKDVKGLGERSIEKLQKRYRTVVRMSQAPKDELIELIGKRAAEVFSEYIASKNTE